jgi:putative transcriptional regulator
MSKRERLPLADRLKISLQEGIDLARSSQSLAVTVVPVGRIYTGDEVISIRTRRNMTQVQFAKLLAVSVKTLQSWEQGVRKPSKPTMRLLQIFDHPEEFREVLDHSGLKTSY